MRAPPLSEQVLTSFVFGRYMEFSIARYFSLHFTYSSEEQWICSNCAGRITVNGSAVKSGRILKEHDYIGVNLGVRQEPRENQTPKVMYEYKHSRIFNKAAPIPVYPSRRFFKNSMTEILKVPASSRGLCSDWMRLRQVI